MKMRRGNINRLLNYLERQLAKAQSKGTPVESIAESIRVLSEFLKTPAGFAFDQKTIKCADKIELLKMAYAAMK